jgi:hypothetical protein
MKTTGCVETITRDLPKLGQTSIVVAGITITSWHYEFGSSQKIFCLATSYDGKELRTYESDTFIEWRGVYNGVVDSLRDLEKIKCGP